MATRAGFQCFWIQKKNIGRKIRDTMMRFSSVVARTSLLRSALTKTTACAFSTHTNLYVNAVGADRPGIVSDMTKFVTDAGGNVGRSQAARLGNHFSLMMQIEVPTEKVQTLREQLQTMPGMNATIFEAKKVETTLTPHVAYTGQFELEGASYPGIVYNVTSVLAKHGLSIDTMGTVEEIAPHGGTHLFRMKGVAHAFDPLPKSFSANDIRKELRELGDSLNCDITLDDVDDESYSGSFYGD